MYDSNEQDTQIAAEANKYAVKHKLAIEGQYVRKGTNVLYEPFTAAKYQQFKNNDNISHFICRLAYCRNEELRKWFLTQETRLFSLRLQATRADEIKNLLRDRLNIDYQSLSETDDIWKKFQTHITFNVASGKDNSASSFVKVPFKDATHLVSRRQVFLHKGIAFVHITDLSYIAAAQFRSNLAKEMVLAFKYISTIFKDRRISELLVSLSNHNAIDFNLTEVKAPEGDTIKLGDLDYHSRKSFPPCMKALLMALRNHHHLKHYGRL